MYFSGAQKPQPHEETDKSTDKKQITDVCTAGLIIECDKATYVCHQSVSLNPHICQILSDSVFLFINSPSGQELHPVHA